MSADDYRASADFAGLTPTERANFEMVNRADQQGVVMRTDENVGPRRPAPQLGYDSRDYRAAQGTAAPLVPGIAPQSPQVAQMPEFVGGPNEINRQRNQWLQSQQKAGNRIATTSGYFERDQTGNWKPVVGPDGKPLMPTSGQSTANNQALALARSFEALPEVKTFNTYAPSVVSAAQYIAGLDPKVGKQPSNTDDLALSKLFLAMTHPKGDQISNMDRQELKRLPDLPGRIRSAVVNVVDGQQLDPDIRKQMWATIQGKYYVYKDAHAKRRKEFEDRIKAMPGVDPSAVFGQQAQ
jgi:hypothetical protein